MMKRFLTFIEVSQSRDCFLHLSAAEDLMQDFISMNRMKYRRMFAAYIADKRHLKTAVGRDHAGEQVNRELKTRGG